VPQYTYVISSHTCLSVVGSIYDKERMVVQEHTSLCSSKALLSTSSLLRTPNREQQAPNHWGLQKKGHSWDMMNNKCEPGTCKEEEVMVCERTGTKLQSNAEGRRKMRHLVSSAQAQKVPQVLSRIMPCSASWKEDGARTTCLPENPPYASFSLP
ncbi:hypothetical protein IHE44_0012495, partial [Lamprotornis superbus]